MPAVASYIANLFAHRGSFALPSQRYFFPLFDGLPGGTLGYDYARNPCDFAGVHFAGLSEKPSDAVTLQLLPQILDRSMRLSAPVPARPERASRPRARRAAQPDAV